MIHWKQFPRPLKTPYSAWININFLANKNHEGSSITRRILSFFTNYCQKFSVSKAYNHMVIFRNKLYITYNFELLQFTYSLRSSPHTQNIIAFIRRVYEKRKGNGLPANVIKVKIFMIMDAGWQFIPPSAISSFFYCVCICILCYLLLYICACNINPFVFILAWKLNYKKQHKKNVLDFTSYIRTQCSDDDYSWFSQVLCGPIHHYNKSRISLYYSLLFFGFLFFFHFIFAFSFYIVYIKGKTTDLFHSGLCSFFSV